MIGATIGLLPDDLRERMMLGDTGANVLGGVLGFAVVLECGRTTRNIVIVVLIVLNLLSEFVSFSRVIERVPRCDGSISSVAGRSRRRSLRFTLTPEPDTAAVAEVLDLLVAEILDRGPAAWGKPNRIVRGPHDNAHWRGFAAASTSRPR